MSRRGRPKTTVCKDKADYVSLARLQKESDERRFAMRARLRKRDLDYAASPCAAQVTVDCVRTTDGRTLVVETRGRTVVGFHASNISKSV